MYEAVTALTTRYCCCSK